MIKVTFQKNETESNKTYPKLMVSDSGTIVYFTSDRCGVALNDDRFTDYGIEWNMQFFTDYNEPITLQNA